MKIKVFLIVTMLMLAGCGGNSPFNTSDGKFLCDPIEKKAYVVKSHLGDTSFVKPLPQADVVCEIYKEIGYENI